MVVSQSVRLEAVVHGMVHGVGFRVSAARQARRLGLAGTVANIPDGTVSIVAEGPRADVERFAAWLRQGPPGAQVERIAVSWRHPSNEWTSFLIV